MVKLRFLKALYFPPRQDIVVCGWGRGHAQESNFYDNT